MEFKNKLKDLITLFDIWLSVPEDTVQCEHWIETAEELAHSFEFTEIEQQYVDRIIEMYEAQFKHRLTQRALNMSAITTSPGSTSVTDIPSQEFLDALLNRKQIEQRTPEWYAQMTKIISASELGSLFASPRTRAKLVMAKTVEYTPRFQPLAVPSDYMSAFDWGIRFEPVVKQIYEAKYGAKIKDLGRMIHPEDERCSASPDGLIYECEAVPAYKGRLIEIKCPVSREIDGKIPKDYYAQMQMQLQVTGCKQCEYVEASFASKYNNTPIKEGPAQFSGTIALVRYNEMKGDQEFYYIYSPINIPDWEPEIKEGEEIVELIPWRLFQLSIQTVLKNEDWWNALKPLINRFWDDVAAAKRGEFEVPESTRPQKRAKKDDDCMIIFTKLDEDGNVI
jgi:putative phage-type endonuclease